MSEEEFEEKYKEVIDIINNTKTSLMVEDFIEEMYLKIQQQQKEIKGLNEKISKAIGHIEACKTTLGNYVLTPDEIECLLNILKEKR